MLRRLISTPAHRPRRCKFPTGRNASRLASSFGSGFNGSDTAAARQRDGSPELATPRNIHQPSHTFELHDIRSRQLSSEAIWAQSPSGNHELFGITGAHEEDITRRTFLGNMQGNNLRDGEGAGESIAFLELFKAISTLERHSHSAATVDVSVLEIETDTMACSAVIEGDRENVDTDPTIDETYKGGATVGALEAKTATAPKEKAPKAAVSEEQQRRNKLRGSLSLALANNQTERVAKIFEEARSSPERDLLTDKNLRKTFQHFLERDFKLAYEVLKHQESRYEERGKRIPRQYYTDMYNVAVNSDDREGASLNDEDMWNVFQDMVRVNTGKAINVLRYYEARCRQEGRPVDADWDTSIVEELEGREFFKVFNHFVDSDVTRAYELLKCHAARRKEQGRLVDFDLYAKLFNRIRSVGVRHDPRDSDKHFVDHDRRMGVSALKELADDMANHMIEEYSVGKKAVYQYLLLPTLAASLAEHRHPWINECAKPIVEFMLNTDEFLQLSPELFEHMLGRASSGRTGPSFLPHHKVLSWLVSNGNRPKPENVMNVLQCYQPFTDTEAVHEVLSAIKALYPEYNPSPSPGEDYRVDLGTLESISLRASAASNIDLCLLVWDLVELFGHAPTESMFEDVVLSFASIKFSDENMYAALVDMDGNGYAPSRVLQKLIAVKLSKYPKRLDHSYKLLTWRENEHIRSTHSLNALLMGYGMSGNIESAFRVFEDFTRFNIRPDETTFTFLMEVLYIDTKNRFQDESSHTPLQCSPEDTEDVLGAAQIILDSMEEAGISKPKLFYHEYIRVLCTLGRLDDARLVLEEAIADGTPIPLATLFVLASRFAETGNYAMAHEIAESSVAAGCGEDQTIANRIRNIERRQREALYADVEVGQVDVHELVVEDAGDELVDTEGVKPDSS